MHGARLFALLLASACSLTSSVFASELTDNRLQPALSAQKSGGTVDVEPDAVTRAATIRALPAAFAVAKGATLKGQLPAKLDPRVSARFVVYTKPVAGELTYNEQGQFSYRPDKTSPATYDSLEFYLVYPGGSTSLALVSFALLPAVNQAPTLQTTQFNGSKGQTLTGQLMASDADGDQVTLKLVKNVSAGSLTLQPDGKFSFLADRKLAADQVNFTVQLSDGIAVLEQVITIQLAPFVNHAPVSTNQQLQANHDDTVVGVLHSTDEDQDPLTYRLLSGPQQGVLQLKPNGQWQWVAPQQLSEPVSFSYVASDGELASAPATVSLQPTGQLAPLNGSSYRQIAKAGATVQGVVLSSTEPVIGGQAVATGLTVLQAPRFGKVELVGGGYRYWPADESVQQDRFVLRYTDNTGQAASARIEIDYRPPLVTPAAQVLPPLATDWQSEQDFPAALQPILDGVDPFDDFDDFSNATAYQALQVLDWLLRHHRHSDLRVKRLGYYLRAYYFKQPYTGDYSTLWLQSQWPQVADLAARWQQQAYFYSTSKTGAMLQEVFNNAFYVLQYHQQSTATQFELLNSVEPLLELYQRVAIMSLAYPERGTMFELLQIWGRQLSGIRHVAPIEATASKRLADAMQAFAASQTLYDPVDGNSYWLLNGVNHMARWLYEASHESERPKLVDAVADLYRNAALNWPKAKLEFLRIRFYIDFLKSSVGYRQPELAVSQCSGLYADVCLQPLVSQILPELAQCPGPVRLVYARLDNAQVNSICQTLDQTQTRFHALMKTAGQPLPDDHNTELEAVIFNDPEHYHEYGGVLYDVDTDNGGIYLEGNPADPANQARYLAYQRVINDQWQVWNLAHEYTHYLDGRFIQKGDFAASQQMVNCWWAEGLAEWVAWGEEFPRGFNTLRNTPAEQRPDLNKIFSNNYQSTDLTYHWSYTVHYYLVKQAPELHQAIAACLKNGDAHCVRNLENRLMAEHSQPYADFVSALAKRDANEMTAMTPAANAQQAEALAAELRELEAHSAQHRQPSAVMRPQPATQPKQQPKQQPMQPPGPVRADSIQH